MKATEKNLLTFHYDNADLEVWPVNIIKYTWMAVLLQREHNSQHDTACIQRMIDWKGMETRQIFLVCL